MQLIQDTLYALNLWIHKYDLVVEQSKQRGGKPTLYLVIPLCKDDILKTGRVKITDSFEETLESLLIPKEEIEYAMQTDMSIQLNRKMFSLFCKSPFFRPELIHRASFKNPHRHLICKKYEDYVNEAFGFDDADEEDIPKSNMASYLIAVQTIKERYPHVKESVKRLMEQGVFFDFLHGIMLPHEKSDENMRRLYDIFIRLHGLYKLAKMDEKDIKEAWGKFKERGNTSVEDWQVLFL